MPFISQTVAKCILEFQMFGKIVKTCCKIDKDWETIKFIR